MIFIEQKLYKSLIFLAKSRNVAPLATIKAGWQRQTRAIPGIGRPEGKSRPWCWWSNIRPNGAKRTQGLLNSFSHLDIFLVSHQLQQDTLELRVAEKWTALEENSTKMLCPCISFVPGQVDKCFQPHECLVRIKHWVRL